MTSIKSILSQTHLNQTIIALCPTSVSKPSIIHRTVRNMANIDRPSINAEHCSVSEFLSVEKANQYCDFLRTVLDKHAPLLSGK